MGIEYSRVHSLYLPTQVLYNGHMFHVVWKNEKSEFALKPNEFISQIISIGKSSLKNMLLEQYMQCRP